MQRRVVSYRMKPEGVEENQRLIEGVFRQLRAEAPEGVRYMVLRLDDGSFLHVVEVDHPDGSNPIPGLPAFKAFQAAFRERCAEAPQTRDAIMVGEYRMLSSA